MTALMDMWLWHPRRAWAQGALSQLSPLLHRWPTIWWRVDDTIEALVMSILSQSTACWNLKQGTGRSNNHGKVLSILWCLDILKGVAHVSVLCHWLSSALAAWGVHKVIRVSEAQKLPWWHHSHSTGMEDCISSSLSPLLKNWCHRCPPQCLLTHDRPW